MTTTVDDEAVKALIMEIERLADWRGWDQPAVLYVLYDSYDHTTEQTYHELMGNFGPVVRRRRYAARPMVPVHVLNHAGWPSHNLFRMALNLAHSGRDMVDQLVEAVAQPGFLGVAFAYEGWMRTDMNAEQYQEHYRTDKRAFVDMPGSIEFRSVVATTAGGTECAAGRQRGSAPEVLEWGRSEGAVVESLRAITAKIAGKPIPEIVNTPFRWKWPAEATTDGTS